MKNKEQRIREAIIYLQKNFPDSFYFCIAFEGADELIAEAYDSKQIFKILEHFRRRTEEFRALLRDQILGNAENN